MRTCNKNKIKIWYVQNKITKDAVDEHGNYTGEVISEYESPKEMMINFYPSTGEVIRDIFGEYASGEMVSTVMGKPFNKNTLLFLNEPTGIIEETYDYKMSDIKESINSSYYLWKKRV